MIATSLAAVILASSASAMAPGDSVPIGGWTLQDASQVAANGAEISTSAFRAEHWYKAVVPGTVLTSLVQDGVYPDPLYGENNRAIPESLCRTSYWYRTTFGIPSSFAGRHSWLNFDGINTMAEVWVNGSRVGNIKGAFARGQFDITDFVRSGRATVAVKILPPNHPGNPHEHTVAAGTGRNGGLLGADGPTFEATVGWDWIPGIRDRDMGIWQGVSLSSTGPVSIEDPYISSSLPSADSAELTISVGLTNLNPTPVRGTLVCRVEGTHWGIRVPVTASGGASNIYALPTIRAEKPKLWWPNGYGKPNLYKLHTEFVVYHGEVSDSKTTSFGIRTISYFPDGGKNLTLIVNGVPVFAKGGNWGMDEAMKRSPRSRLEAQVRLHRDANYTIIRNWVGMATEEDFYDMCDKYGIMVWDDFWLANPSDGPAPYDEDLFLANAREKITRFRNHPSIAVWCGRNEGFPPKKINDGLASMIAELDGKRFYQPHSSATNGVGGGGPYSYRPPGDYFTFRDAFHTEVGGPSIPTLEAIENMMPRKDWWPINDDWAEHDFCRGAQGGDRYPAMLTARFGRVTGLEDFVRKSQLANYECYRAIYEGREAKLFKPATGVMIWMSNPSQPSFVWQLYTHDLEPTAALFGAKKGCEPVHIMMDPRDGSILAVNNTGVGLGKATAVATVYGLDGAKLSTQSMSASVGASESAAMFTLDRSKVPDVYFVRLELRSSSGRLLSDNFYWNAKSGGDLPTMDSTPVVQVEAKARLTTPTQIEITLRNSSKAVAVMTHLQLRRAASGVRVLPAYFSDNYVSLVPGETKRLTVEFAAKDLAGEKPLLVMDGWNVRAAGTASRDADAVPVVTNEEAIPREFASRFRDPSGVGIHGLRLTRGLRPPGYFP